MDLVHVSAHKEREHVDHHNLPESYPFPAQSLTPLHTKSSWHIRRSSLVQVHDPSSKLNNKSFNKIVPPSAFQRNRRRHFNEGNMHSHQRLDDQDQQKHGLSRGQRSWLTSSFKGIWQIYTCLKSLAAPALDGSPASEKRLSRESLSIGCSCHLEGCDFAT